MKTKVSLLSSLLLASVLWVSCGPSPKADQTVTNEKVKPLIINEEQKLQLPMKDGKHILPELPYAYNALEPYIDQQTMEIHHTRHHQAYITNLNNAIEGTEMAGMSLEAIFQQMSKYPAAVRNNGGGHYNHTLFWEIMAPNAGGKPSGKLLEAIEQRFGSFEQFQEDFNKAALTRFGSGWAWLLVDTDGKLQISSTANQDNPLMDTEAVRGIPVMGIDVWEHAYYLKYQNKRPDYVGNFWNVIN